METFGPDIPRKKRHPSHKKEFIITAVFIAFIAVVFGLFYLNKKGFMPANFKKNDVKDNELVSPDGPSENENGSGQVQPLSKENIENLMNQSSTTKNDSEPKNIGNETRPLSEEEIKAIMNSK